MFNSSVVRSFEIGELTLLITLSIGVIVFISVALKKNKELLKWIPSIIALWVAFLSTNLETMEAIGNSDAWNYIEHFSAMLAALFMLIASSVYFYQIYLKNKKAEKVGKK